MTTPVLTTVRRMLPCACQPRPAGPGQDPAEALHPERLPTGATTSVPPGEAAQ